MPRPEHILANLTAIARGAAPLALAWHALALAAAAALALGVRPSARLAGLMLALPLVSVAGAAVAFDSPFNAALLGLAACALAALSLRAPPEPVRLRRGWSGWLAGALALYALVYPHFLEPGSALRYLVEAPLGVVPCPTLALLVAACLGGLVPGRSQRGVVVGLATFYAVFGVLRLSVLLDLGLLAGAAVLLAQLLVERRRSGAEGTRDAGTALPDAPR